MIHVDARYLGLTANQLAKIATDLKAENDKLRELARGLGQCAQGTDCEDCLLYDLSEPDHCREERLSRELGIEVGNGTE